MTTKQRPCGEAWTTARGATGSNHMCVLPKGHAEVHSCASCAEVSVAQRAALGQLEDALIEILRHAAELEAVTSEDDLTAGAEELAMSLESATALARKIAGSVQ